MTYELYRNTTLGMCLQDSLDEMIGTHQMSPQLALKVLKQFDKSVSKALSSRVRTKYSFKAQLKTYRYCDNVWTCLLKDVEVKEGQVSDIVRVDKVKIVACDAGSGGSSSGGGSSGGSSSKSKSSSNN